MWDRKSVRPGSPVTPSPSTPVFIAPDGGAPSSVAVVATRQGLKGEHPEASSLEVTRTYVSSDFYQLLRALKFVTGLTFPEITSKLAKLLIECEAVRKEFGLKWE